MEQELRLDHRWFPLDESLPTDPVALDQQLAPVQALDPDAGWRSWADAGAPPAGPARLAATWVQAAKAQSPAASMALDRAPVVCEDDPTVHDEIVERFLAQRHYD